MAEIDINNEHELLNAGYDALIKALGVGGFLKFMGHFHGGTGDYTAEKYERPEMSFPEIMAGIVWRRALNGCTRSLKPLKITTPTFKNNSRRKDFTLPRRISAM
ncbi:MAG: hypothetical protein IKD80_09205 [Selenomonadaceae bacterium]|nr:hypothetical protein [Selenomonadaceae bacterium]